MPGEIPTHISESEVEVVLKQGITVLQLPDFSRESRNHPMVMDDDKSPRIPLSADAVCSELEKFFKFIEAQGAQIVGMTEVPVTTNMDEVEYAEDAKISKKAFVIVKK